MGAREIPGLGTSALESVRLPYSSITLSWAGSDGVTSDRLRAIVVQPEMSLECFCLCIHPLVCTPVLAKRRRQDDGSRVAALC